MGRVFQRKGKTDSTWYIEYYYQGEQCREKVGRKKDGVTERMAKESLKSRMGDVAKGKFDIAQTKSYPTLNKLVTEYLEWSKVHKRSYERDAASAKHIKAYFGNKRSNEVSPWLLEKYKAKRRDEIIAKYPDKDEKDVSLASINRELAFLKTVYSMGIKWEKIDQNPVKGIKMFKEKSVERYLEVDEINALLKACESSKNRSLKGIVATAVNTGMRLREILYLRTKDIDFKISIINIEDSKNGDRGKVPINDFLKGILKEHLKSHKHEYVFCDSGGKPYDDIRYSFTAALKTEGIESFRFHDLRHTFASQLALNGVDLYTIQKLGRWKTLSMVMKYAHLSPEHQQTAANVLGGIIQAQNKDKLSTNLIEGKFGGN